MQVKEIASDVNPYTLDHGIYIQETEGFWTAIQVSQDWIGTDVDLSLVPGQSEATARAVAAYLAEHWAGVLLGDEYFRELGRTAARESAPQAG